MVASYEVVIGLEVHAQLRTASKLFCGCKTDFGQAPNSQTCPICLGMPGVLPRLNAHAVDLALRAALGLHCQIHSQSRFARKNYFYPDLPKGYQITQDDLPIAGEGYLDVEWQPQPGAETQSQRVRIMRLHMEEDAGKNVHDTALAGDYSYVDFNRGGMPLIEIVSHPDLRSSAAAAAYLKTLRQLLRYLGVCDGNMEEGSLRCDANVSLRPQGQVQLGQRVELKNINSFKFVAQAIEYEIARQTQILSSGGSIRQETRLWDSQAKATRSMRSKEQAADYRYFPEPDLPDLMISAAHSAAIAASLPELPAQKLARYCATYGLPEADARILIEDIALASFFEEAASVSGNAKGAANWIINELLRELRGEDLQALPISAAHLGELVALIDAGTISGKIAKDLFARMIQGEGSPKDLVARLDLQQISNEDAIAAVVAQVLADNPDSIARYKQGKTNVLGFLVGQVLKQMQGKANPQVVNKLILAAISAPAS